MSIPTARHICLQDVSRVFETRADRVTALHEVSFAIEKGERVALLGRSGSGKSTLLNLLGGLDRVSSGTLLVGGDDLGQLDSDALAAYRLTSVGMIFQGFNLIHTKTAVQNVEVPLMLSRQPHAARLEKSLAALASVGLKDRAHHRPSEMSGGEQQRVAIARALANEPTLILADEPTGNLDSTTGNEVVELLQQYSDTHQTTVVLVTHDEELATSFANRTLRLKDGQLTGS